MAGTIPSNLTGRPLVLQNSLEFVYPIHTTFCNQIEPLRLFETPVNEDHSFGQFFWEPGEPLVL